MENQASGGTKNMSLCARWDQSDQLFVVGTRRREIAIRMAVGAHPRLALALVLRQQKGDHGNPTGNAVCHGRRQAQVTRTVAFRSIAWSAVDQPDTL
jgi:hypothetical protein